MDRNRGNFRKQSRFEPMGNRNAPHSNMQRAHNQQMQDFHQMPLNYQQNSLPPSLSSTPLTDEQLAFELEFKKWEQSFLDWQKAYSNHPDRQAYQQYEEKFLQVRDKLLIKRQQIYKNTISTSSTHQKLAHDLVAAAAMADNILQKFGEPSSGNYGRDQRGGRDDRRGRDERRGRDSFSGRDDRGSRDSRGGQRDRDSRGRMDDRGGRDSRGRMNDRGGRDDRGRRDSRGGRDARGGRNDRSSLSERKSKSTRKPTEAQLRNELRRKNVYPNNKWINVSAEGKPPLVGKRKKVKNAKIQRVLEQKENPENGDVVESEEGNRAQYYKDMLAEAKLKECPNRLSGSSRKKFFNVQRKLSDDPESLTEEEKIFMEYAQYIRKTRDVFYGKMKTGLNPDTKQISTIDS